MSEHYFSPSQNSPEKNILIKASLRGVQVELIASSGVFSKSRIDPGSALLIESAIVKDGWLVLDLGCGYGPVGVILAKAFPNSRFLLSDLNERAVSLAEKNIQKNHLNNAKALQSDGFQSIPESFDTVLLNPPQTAGRVLCVRLFKESYDHLKKGGLLQIVARKNKGGETLSKVMKDIFGNVRTIAKKSGYCVYISEK